VNDLKLTTDRCPYLDCSLKWKYPLKPNLLVIPQQYFHFLNRIPDHLTCYSDCRSSPFFVTLYVCARFAAQTANFVILGQSGARSVSV